MDETLKFNLIYIVNNSHFILYQNFSTRSLSEFDVNLHYCALDPSKLLF